MRYLHRYAIERPRRKILISAQVAAARPVRATLRTAAGSWTRWTSTSPPRRRRAGGRRPTRRARRCEEAGRTRRRASGGRSEREAAEARGSGAAPRRGAGAAGRRGARGGAASGRRGGGAGDRSRKGRRGPGRGIASVDAALRTLAASAGEAYGDAVAALRDILEAIVEKPDDDARRRLRCANAAFARDVDNFDGGRQVLFSAGFQLTHRSSGVEPAQDNEEDDWQVWESLLVLREPNPLSDGFDAWTAWFDNLKACHARLRDEAERLEASRPSKGLLAGAAPSWVDTKRSLY